MATAKQPYWAIICGHGKSSSGSWDPGCVYKKDGVTYTEADLMLAITKAFVKYAKMNGIKVYTDASGGNMKNMNKTISEANAKGVDGYISLHCDYKGAPAGTYPYYYTGSSKGKKLANTLNKAVMKRTGIKTRKIHGSTTLGEVTLTNMVSCIFETGSIKADLALLKNKPDTYGKALAEGLCNYLEIKFKDTTVTTTTSKTPSVPFVIIPKANLKVREGSSLTSKVNTEATCKKGTKYTVTETALDGTRGKLKSGAGWVTITDNYVEIVK